VSPFVDTDEFMDRAKKSNTLIDTFLVMAPLEAQMERTYKRAEDTLQIGIYNVAKLHKDMKSLDLGVLSRYPEFNRDGIKVEEDGLGATLQAQLFTRDKFEAKLTKE
jgi:hypothetical protein